MLDRRDGEGKPYVVAEHPYSCTIKVWGNCILAPFHLKREDPFGRAWATFATITWPLWLVDEIGEVGFDTLFLPADAVYAMVKGNGNGEMAGESGDETICIEEAIMQEEEKRK